jgi:thiamine phosphate synthase YjbQ (UPF0047 family)
MKKIVIKSKQEPWSAIEITDAVQAQLQPGFNGFALLYAPDTEVNIFTGEYDPVLPIDYSRTAQHILAGGRPFKAENGEAATFNFMHACEKMMPVIDGKISLGKLLRVYMFDSVGGGKDRTLWLYELKD